jgi:exoribonuclease R
LSRNIEAPRTRVGRLREFEGRIGDIASETAALLLEWNVDERPFSAAVEGCLPATPWRIPASELAKRRDLRELRICSIDPPTARDLDDALHCIRHADGSGYEVGVHIADVSHFIQPGTALDLEAAKRSTSVYLVQKVIPMLPRLLCEQLCSLNPGEDRLAFSVIWQLDAKGEVIPGRTWFGRTVIRSCFKLHYGQAQQLIDGEAVPELEAVEGLDVGGLCTDVQNLAALARQRRARRFEGGALRLDTVKLCFRCDAQTALPIETWTYALKESNSLVSRNGYLMSRRGCSLPANASSFDPHRASITRRFGQVEEWMLLANESVATKLHETFPRLAVLRRHSSPDPQLMTATQEELRKYHLRDIIMRTGILN